MPAIRDFSYAYESSTSDAGLTVPMCSYEVGDLLIVFCMSDTGTPTWGCSSGTGTWNQLFTRNNTCATVCFWKYAESGEGAISVTSTVNETYNGIVIAVKDVFAGYTGGSPPQQSNVNQASSSRFTLPSVTTTHDDSLVLFAAFSSVSAAISMGEGVVQLIACVDGAAEGSGYGWLYQRTAGAIPTSRAFVTAATGAGVNATVVVRPPASGATIRPLYTVDDDSILITPNAALAWDGNTAHAADAAARFGSPINGFTISTPTLATAADAGIDPGAFCASAGNTNTASTSATLSGSTAAVASSRYNIGSRAILGHVRNATPANNQRLSSVGSGRGAWFGIRSGTTDATNYNIWQVHGSDAARGGNVVPFVVQPGSTNQIATDGTLDTSDVRLYGFWNGGVLNLTNQLAFGPIWAIGTLTVAGGSSSAPITVTNLGPFLTYEKFRVAGTLQGAAQLIINQPLQFGDGGTNPLNLNLTNCTIEFPSTRNVEKKLVNFNATQNFVGITYYPGAGDIVVHKNSTISSASRYHWRLHSSASTSASYDFSGTSVIGAGDIVLNKAITISQITINNYQTLDISNLTLNNSTITNPPNSNNSITLNSSTTLNGCDINVTTLSAGNYLLSTATPNQFSNCTFTGSTSSGHAIRITTPGTYSFSGNTFTGFGADGTTSAAIFNDSGGLVTLNITGGGNTPTVRNGTGASTTINNAVNLTVTVKNEAGSPIQNARVSLQKTTANSMAGAVAYTGTYTDETTAANNSTANDMTLLPTTPAVNDAYYFGGKEPFYKLRLNIGTAGAGTWAITWEYYNGSTWAAIPDVYDPTNGFKAGTGNFNIVFSPPNDWASTTVSGIPAYWIRARVSSISLVTTQPKGTQAWVYLQIMNKTTDTNGQASETYNYSSDEDVNIIIRKSSTGSTRYYPVVTTQTITTSGLNLTWTLIQDKIAST